MSSLSYWAIIVTPPLSTRWRIFEMGSTIGTCPPVSTRRLWNCSHG